MAASIFVVLALKALRLRHVGNYRAEDSPDENGILHKGNLYVIEGSVLPRKRGHEDGRKEGRYEGRKEGRTEGREEGRKQG
jgi:hypothetical protein